jgi:hypothetical protein
MTIEEIVNHHPLPWRHSKTSQPGLLVMLDARNQIVELLVMIEYVEQITARIVSEANAKVTPS